MHTDVHTCARTYLPVRYIFQPRKTFQCELSLLIELDDYLASYLQQLCVCTCESVGVYMSMCVCVIANMCRYTTICVSVHVNASHCVYAYGAYFVIFHMYA